MNDHVDPLIERALHARASLQDLTLDRAVPPHASVRRQPRQVPRLLMPVAAALAVVAVVAVSLWGGAQVPRPRVTPGVVSSVPVAQRPGSVATDGTLVWVADLGTDRVVAVDVRTLRERWTVDIGSRPDDLVIGLGALWVVTQDGHLLKLDPTTGRKVAQARTSLEPVAVDVAFGAVWVLSAGNQTLDRYDATTVRQTGAALLAGTGSSLTHSRAALWVCSPTGLVRIQATTSTALPVTRVAVPCTTLAADGQGSLWVVRRDGSLVGLNGDTGALLARVALGAQVSALVAAGDAVLVATHDGLVQRVAEPGQPAVPLMSLGVAAESLASHDALLVATLRSSALLYATEISP